MAEAHETTLGLGTAAPAQCISSRRPAARAIAQICRKRLNWIAAANSLVQLNCVGCHRIAGIDAPTCWGPT